MCLVYLSRSLIFSLSESLFFRYVSFLELSFVLMNHSETPFKNYLCYEMYPLKHFSVDSSVVLSTFTLLWPSPEIFTLRTEPTPIKQPPPLLSPAPGNPVLPVSVFDHSRYLMREWNHTVLVLLWLAYFTSRVSSSSVHIACNLSEFPYFSMSNDVLLHVYMKLLRIGELNSFIFVNTGIPQRYCRLGSRAPQ